ncbi:HNH endonuclease [Caulobacter sp. RHG1]|uniref:HNH endonuclease n=1 Tax=Caulobacter sp. (strain RHG1) TaxID=2545762 RepID=UPI0015577B32|nr:hypothetical protein [Caulobacter sp. RHG1]
MAERRVRRDFTREEVLRVLDYDPETGGFRWRVKRRAYGGHVEAGAVAGAINADGYVQIGLWGAHYRAQHLAWLIMTGEWPPSDLDVEHENRIRSDNAWRNLRLATRSQNNMNAGLRSDNKSGHKGVSFRRDTAKWHARIKVGGQVILLGNFEKLADAVAARRAAERRYFGDFAAISTEN